MFSPWSALSQATMVCFMYMQHITTLQAQGMYIEPPDTTQHIIIAHRKGRAERNSPTRLPSPAVITCQVDIVVTLHVQHVTALQAHKMYGNPLDKLRHLQGMADSNSPSRSGLCPAIIMSQNNTTVSLHVHAACHSTVSSGTVWQASGQTQVPLRQGRQLPW